MVDFLRDFIHILRSSDLRVSTSESIDAMNVVSEIGIEDRSLLKHSLSFSLAKTLREKEIFNECFDNFFEENYMNLSEDKLPQKNNEKDPGRRSGDRKQAFGGSNLIWSLSLLWRSLVSLQRAFLATVKKFD